MTKQEGSKLTDSVTSPASPLLPNNKMTKAIFDGIKTNIKSSKLIQRLLNNCSQTGVSSNQNTQAMSFNPLLSSPNINSYANTPANAPHPFTSSMVSGYESLATVDSGGTRGQVDRMLSSPVTDKAMRVVGNSRVQ